MLPESIGRYQIREELGRGQSTAVYRALDTQANREVVVKLFSIEPTGDTAHDLSLKAHFRRELKMISSLEHSAIVPIYDVGEHEGQPYFVMRFMAGGSLNGLIAKKGRLSLQETAEIIDRIAPALNVAHKLNIIHRDVKPDNILFDFDGHPYISDFGIGRPDKKDDLLAPEGQVGTPGYMSPEQINEEDVDERTDVYSLGVVICQMLSGKPPSKKEADSSTSSRKDPEYTVPNILSEVPELPPEMQDFVRIALAKNKQDRYVTTLHLARALHHAAFGEDNTSVLGRRQSRWAPVRTSLTWVFGSLLLLAAFIWIFARGGSIPFLAIASTPTLNLTPSEAAVSPTETFTPIPPAATATLEPTSTSEPEPPINKFPGGADQIAVVSGNQIYLMNTDGSGLTQVRTENSPKSNLQWIAGNRLVYVSRNCAYLLDAETKQTQRLSCFETNEQLEGFTVSPDGQYVAISVQRTLNIFPFDIDLLRAVTTRFNLVENKDNCFYNQFPFLEVFWSTDQNRLTAHVIDTRLTNSDQLFLLNADIQNCDNVDLTRIDTIPGGRIEFDTDSTKRIGSFDWNGKDLFLINDAIRNDGFGNLYLYNSDTNEVTKINPIDGQCCYRDPVWSPDGTYILFAYQRFDRSSIDLYYIPFADLQSGEVFTPIELPGGFFATARDKPQPVLRPSP